MTNEKLEPLSETPKNGDVLVYKHNIGFEVKRYLKFVSWKNLPHRIAYIKWLDSGLFDYMPVVLGTVRLTNIFTK